MKYPWPRGSAAWAQRRRSSARWSSTRGAAAVRRNSAEVTFQSRWNSERSAGNPAVTNIPSETSWSVWSRAGSRTSWWRCWKGAWSRSCPAGNRACRSLSALRTEQQSPADRCSSGTGCRTKQCWRLLSSPCSDECRLATSKAIQCFWTAPRSFREHLFSTSLQVFITILEEWRSRWATRFANKFRTTHLWWA